MRMPSQLSSSAFSILHSTKHTKASGQADGQIGGLAAEMAETNKRLDNVLKNQNATPEQKAKLEEIRRQFNERLTKVGGETTDRTKLMTEYRSARRDLSEQLSNLFGGPRAG
jgi:Spy/CpxP family protein refolding chaperone